MERRGTEKTQFGNVGLASNFPSAIAEDIQLSRVLRVRRAAALGIKPSSKDR